MIRLARRKTALAFAFAAALAISAAPGSAGEDRVAPATLGVQSDMCGFFRAQAYGRGLEHYATEMLWACEAIARRKAADMPLSDRLLAVELALLRYRDEIVASSAAAFRSDRARQHDTGYIGTGETIKAQIAESTGMLAALEAIRSGF